MGERFFEIALRVNGEEVRERVEARKTLVDFLRDDLGLTGTHIGCEQGVCGACTILLDDAVVRGCLLLAVQCDGAEVQTIEGLSDSGVIADLQDAFRRRNALQCGFCTPGIRHREIACSDDFEVLEIVSPANFATRIVEAPQADAQAAE